MFDASTLVGAAIRPSGVPQQALRLGIAAEGIAISQPVLDEVVAVLARPRLSRFLNQAAVAEVVRAITREAVMVVPSFIIRACRDPTDDKYLELALAASASVIVSSDADLLVLDPWRGVRILRPAAYLVSGR